MKCLIVVDYQVDFVSGSLGNAAAAALDAGIAARIRRARERGEDVIFTLDTHEDNYLFTREGKYLPVPHCIRGTEGHGLYGEVAKARCPEDALFCKETFGSKELFASKQTLSSILSPILSSLSHLLCLYSEIDSQIFYCDIVNDILWSGAHHRVHQMACVLDAFHLILINRPTSCRHKIRHNLIFECYRVVVSLVVDAFLLVMKNICRLRLVNSKRQIQRIDSYSRLQQHRITRRAITIDSQTTETYCLRISR